MAPRAAASRPLRVDGLVRVSRVGGREGPSFISPRVQLDGLETWATLRGAELLQVFEELDTPGARPDRPLLDEAIQRCQDGITSGIVVYRVDRFGRSLVSALHAIDRVRAAGGDFFSTYDGLDTTTDSGRLVIRILLSMAEWDLERIRANWLTARDDATARGVYAGNRTLRVSQDGQWPAAAEPEDGTGRHAAVSSSRRG